MKIVTVWNNELCVRQVIGLATDIDNAHNIIKAHQKKARLNLDEDIFECYDVEDYEPNTMVYDFGF